MKSCPSCRKTYSDNTLNFCLDDGVALVAATTADQGSVETVFMNRPQTAATERFATSPPMGGPQTYAVGQEPRRSRAWLWILLAVVAIAFLFVGAAGFLLYKYSSEISRQVSTTDEPSNSQQEPPKTDTATTLTKEKYDRIKNGMTKSEVDKLLGGPGDEIMSMDTGIGKFASYRWNGENSSYISVNFTDDKVAGKTQYGIEEQTDTIKNTSAITLEKFEQIKNGMKRSEVEEILGPGSEISSTKSLGKTYSMYQWKDAGFANVMVNFTDDKVTGKSQFGLGDKRVASVEITKANYEKIKNGMSLAEVEKIMGGPGDAITDQSSSGISASVYKWSGSEFAFIVVGFMNGKVIYKSQNGIN